MDLVLLLDASDGSPASESFLEKLRSSCKSSGITLLTTPVDKSLIPEAPSQMVGIVGPEMGLYVDFLDLCESLRIPILVAAEQSPLADPTADSLEVAVVYAPEIAVSNGFIDAARRVAKANLEPGKHELASIK